MVRAIDHLEIVVNDADEMAEFLDMLGFEQVRETDHHGRSLEFKPNGSDGPLIEIHTAEEEEAPGVNHIALLVEDLAGLTERLQEAGLDHVTGPQYTASTGRTATNIRDPDGRRFQLVAAENDRNE